MVAVPVSFDLLIEMMYKDYKVKHGIECVSGVPRGAKFVTANYDPVRNIAFIVFEHKSFEPVELGCEIPWLDITHRSIYPPSNQHLQGTLRRYWQALKSKFQTGLRP